MYPVRYEADFIEPQNRAKAFFRWILVIPWAILGAVYGTVAYLIAVLAWFALLFTGRYPRGLYDFNAGYLRFHGRVSGFAYLQTEEWPSFGFEDDRAYPVRVDVDEPLPSYNRWKVFFRLILGVPVLFMLYLMPYLTLFGAMIAWFHIVFMGRTSGGVHNVITVGNAYTLRAIAYFLLVTETLPPVSDQEPAGNAEGSGPQALAGADDPTGPTGAAGAAVAIPKQAPARTTPGAEAPAKQLETRDEPPGGSS